jgi:hypothetical protein
MSILFALTHLVLPEPGPLDGALSFLILAFLLFLGGSIVWLMFRDPARAQRRAHPPIEFEWDPEGDSPQKPFNGGGIA